MLTLGWAELGKNFLYRFKVVYHWMLQEIFTAKSLLGPLKNDKNGFKIRSNQKIACISKIAHIHEWFPQMILTFY